MESIVSVRACRLARVKSIVHTRQNMALVESRLDRSIDNHDEFDWLRDRAI